MACPYRVDRRSMLQFSVIPLLDEEGQGWLSGAPVPVRTTPNPSSTEEGSLKFPSLIRRG